MVNLSDSKSNLKLQFYVRLKCTFPPITFKKLQFWPLMYKNYNFGPLRFSLFASLVLLINFNLVNVNWDFIKGHGMPHVYIPFFKKTKSHACIFLSTPFCFILQWNLNWNWLLWIWVLQIWILGRTHVPTLSYFLFYLF